jgi:ATP-dependent Clp protease ATP-binding subunit ClpA
MWKTEGREAVAKYTGVRIDYVLNEEKYKTAKFEGNMKLKLSGQVELKDNVNKKIRRIKDMKVDGGNVRR